MAAARIFQSGSYASLTERMLDLLAWRDVLTMSEVGVFVCGALPMDDLGRFHPPVGWLRRRGRRALMFQTCAYLNDFVTASPKLQAELRAGLYARPLPRGPYEKGIERMKEVDQNWRDFKPKRFDLVWLPDLRDGVIVTDGLMVVPRWYGNGTSVVRELQTREMAVERLPPGLATAMGLSDDDDAFLEGDFGSEWEDDDGEEGMFMEDYEDIDADLQVVPGQSSRALFGWSVYNFDGLRDATVPADDALKAVPDWMTRTNLTMRAVAASRHDDLIAGVAGTLQKTESPDSRYPEEIPLRVHLFKLTGEVSKDTQAVPHPEAASPVLEIKIPVGVLDHGSRILLISHLEFGVRLGPDDTVMAYACGGMGIVAAPIWNWRTGELITEGTVDRGNFAAVSIPFDRYTTLNTIQSGHDGTSVGLADFDARMANDDDDDYDDDMNFDAVAFVTLDPAHDRANYASSSNRGQSTLTREFDDRPTSEKDEMQGPGPGVSWLHPSDPAASQTGTLRVSGVNASREFKLHPRLDDGDYERTLLVLEGRLARVCHMGVFRLPRQGRLGGLRDFLDKNHTPPDGVPATMLDLGGLGGWMAFKASGNLVSVTGQRIVSLMELENDPEWEYGSECFMHMSAVDCRPWRDSRPNPRVLGSRRPPEAGDTVAPDDTKAPLPLAESWMRASVLGTMDIYFGKARRWSPDATGAFRIKTDPMLRNAKRCRLAADGVAAKLRRYHARPGDVRWLRADAEHIYIGTATGIAILSF